ncbi:MAG: hypothetical protein JNM43_01235 [Planctomycetaceae bacterium]|nr:hypothetical protein [Planctomycetaceae bacterium]
MNDESFRFSTPWDRIRFIDQAVKDWTGADSHLSESVEHGAGQLLEVGRTLPIILLGLHQSFPAREALWQNLLPLTRGPLELTIKDEPYYMIYRRYIMDHGIMERHLSMIDPPVFADANTGAIMMVDNSLSAFLAKMFFCDSYFPRAKYFFRRAEEDLFDVVSRLQERLFQYPFSPMLNSSEPCWVFHGDDLVIDIADVRVTAACRSEQGCRLMDSLQLRLLPRSARTW